MPTLDNLAFQLGDTGVVLNSDATGLPFVDLDTVDGLDSAPFRTTERDHEGVDGSFMDAEFEKGKTITLEGNIYGDPSVLETYLDSLKLNWSPSTTLLPLYVQSPGVNQRVLFVKPLGVRYKWVRDRRLGTIPVQFQAFAEDPRSYDAALQTVSIGLGGITFNGFGFNLGFSFGYGGTTQIADGKTIINSGNRATPAVLTMYGPVTNPQIINETAGKILSFVIDVANGETLVVDLGNHTVRINGTSNRRSTLQAPDWFYLVPGNTYIRFHASSSTATTVDVVYRNAWW